MSYEIIKVLMLLEAAKFIFNPITKHDLVGVENRFSPLLEQGVTNPVLK